MCASAEFHVVYSKVVDQHKNDMNEWITRLERDGVKAAHPDDGWVNREKNEVHLEYPNFRRKIEVGDRIALGTPMKYRIVVVTAIQKSGWSGLLYYQFVEHGGGL